MKTTHQNSRTALWWTGPLVLLVVLPACNRNDSVTATSPAVTAAPAPAATEAGDVAVVDEAPPPMQQEVMEPQPGPDFVWMAGYWGWRNHRHEWVRGRWERPPHGRREWVQPRWEHRERGYAFVPGRWN